MDLQLSLGTKTTSGCGWCYSSNKLPVISGVPQGSVLGLLLFLVYIDGVELVTLSDKTIVLYADDMVLYQPIYTYEDYWLLQQDIAKCYCYMDYR